jgi:predicted HD phosphohydrolase
MRPVNNGQWAGNVSQHTVARSQINESEYTTNLQLTAQQEQQLRNILSKMIESPENKGNKDSYICTMTNCGKLFSSRFCLKRHLITLHMGFKRFVCNVCGRNFA